MNCVVVYNGVTGTGKSRVVECIKAFYEDTDGESKKAEYIGINNIRMNVNPNNSAIINIGHIRDYSVIEPYSKLLVKMKDGCGKWVDSAEYNTVAQYLRDEESRKLLVKLKNTFELTYPGCSNKYVINQITEYINEDIMHDRFADFTNTINLFFVSIREPENIKNFVDTSPFPVRTLYVDRDKKTEAIDGLDEDYLKEYPYDYIINNPDGISNIFSSIQSIVNEMLRDFAHNTDLKEYNRICTGNGRVGTKSDICFGSSVSIPSNDPFFVPIKVEGTPV